MDEGGKPDTPYDIPWIGLDKMERISSEQIYYCIMPVVVKIIYLAIDVETSVFDPCTDYSITAFSLRL